MGVGFGMGVLWGWLGWGRVGGYGWGGVGRVG